MKAVTIEFGNLTCGCDLRNVDPDRIMAAFIPRLEKQTMSTPIDAISRDLDAARTALASGKNIDVAALIEDFQAIVASHRKRDDELVTMRAVDKNRSEELQRRKSEHDQEIKSAASYRRDNWTLKEKLAASERMVEATQRAFSDNAKALAGAKKALSAQGRGKKPVRIPAIHENTIASLTRQISNAMDSLQGAGIQEIGGFIDTRLARRIDALANSRAGKNTEVKMAAQQVEIIAKELKAAKQIIAEAHELLDKENVLRSSSLRDRITKITSHPLY